MKQYKEYDFDHVLGALLSWMDKFDIAYRVEELLSDSWYDMNGGYSAFETENDEDELTEFENSETFKHYSNIINRIIGMKESEN